jgi:p24 family protein delta-1
VGNEYGKPKDVVGEKRMAFTSHADSAFDVCFENLIEHGKEFLLGAIRLG